MITVVVSLFFSFFLESLFSKLFDSNFGIVTSIGKNCLWIYIFHTYLRAFSRNICNKLIPGIPVISLIIVTLAEIAGPMIVMLVFYKLKIDKVVTKPTSYIWTETKK